MENIEREASRFGQWSPMNLVTSMGRGLWFAAHFLAGHVASLLHGAVDVSRKTAESRGNKSTGCRQSQTVKGSELPGNRWMPREDSNLD